MILHWEVEDTNCCGAVSQNIYQQETQHGENGYTQWGNPNGENHLKHFLLDHKNILKILILYFYHKFASSKPTEQPYTLKILRRFI